MAVYVGGDRVVDLAHGLPPDALILIFSNTGRRGRGRMDTHDCWER